MAISITKPTVGGSEDTWGDTINTALDDIVTEVNAQDGDDWVTTARIADGAVDTAQLAADAVTSAKIAADAVGSSEIASSAVTTAKIASNAVTGVKLATDRRHNANSDVYTGNTSDYIMFDASHGIRFYTATSNDMLLTDAGDLHVDGDIIAYSTTISDERLKTNIQPIEAALDKVCQLNGYTFDYIRDNRASAGVIAQEVEAVLPSAIREQEGGFHGEDGQTYKTVQYDQLHGLLIEAIKELKAEVEALKNGG